MSPHEDPHGPRSYGRMFLVLSHIATVGFIVLLLSITGVISQAYSLIGGTLGVLSVVVMHGARNSDEWIASLWSAGANAGFIGAIAWLVFLPSLEGFIDGLSGATRQQDIPLEGASAAALGCFVIALNFKRIRG